MKNLFLLLSIVLFLQSSSPIDISKPNIIILFCDDLGYGDLSSYGHPTIKTPNLDKMAIDGMKFTNFYSGSPACTASRYTLLTGRYPVRSGFDWVLYPHSKRGMHPKEQTIAEGLKSVGYATGCFGKWHLGSTDEKFLPLQNGFDEYLGLPYSNDMIPPAWGDIPLYDGNEKIEMNPDQRTLTQRYTERAIQFLKQENKKENPFFVYLPYAMPHVPLHPGEVFEGTSKRGKYGDVVEEIDWSVGEILKALESEGIAENTLIIFTSDNGPWIIKKEKGGSSGLLRDGKGSTWEGGMRVPAIAYWKGKTPKNVVNDEPLSVLDLYKTCLNLGGKKLDPEEIVDGRDITKVLLGEAKAKSQPFFYYGPGNHLQAVRLEDWKLHIKTNSQTKKRYFETDTLLFQINHDPSEKWNVAEKHPEIVEKLLSLIQEHQATLKTQPTFFAIDRQKKQVKHLAFNKEVKCVPLPNTRYNHIETLTDGHLETPDRFRYLNGWKSSKLAFLVDALDSKKVKKVKVGFLDVPRNWIFLPKSVTLYGSKDGERYEEIKTITCPVATTLDIERVYYAEFKVRKKYSSFKIVAQNQPCPNWHQGKGNNCWLFVDEIIME